MQFSHKLYESFFNLLSLSGLLTWLTASLTS